MFQKSIVQRWQELNSEVADDLERSHKSAPEDRRLTKRTALLLMVSAIVVFGSIWVVNGFGIASSPNVAISAKPLPEAQVLQKIVLELDEFRNNAIRFRDVGLIAEYADELSPIYSFDRELIESMVKDDIEIRGVKYTLLSVEQISLRRSGTSEFMRLKVSDTRSGYSQITQGKTTEIPARTEGTWELELYRRSGTQKWTLWSAQKTRELQP